MKSKSFCTDFLEFSGFWTIWRKSIPAKKFVQIHLLKLTHFWPMFPFYTPWKQQKTKGFSGVFRGYKMGKLARNGLMRDLNSHLLDFFIGLFPIIKNKVYTVFALISAGPQITPLSNKRSIFGYSHWNKRLPSNKRRASKYDLY